MKAKSRAPGKRGGKRPAKSTPKRAVGSWRVSDLPLDLQVELRDAIDQADRGEDLQDFDKAMDDAERISDEMLAVLARDNRRPIE
jgi:hypothetical protein